jgi:hypothetical protein
MECVACVKKSRIAGQMCTMYRCGHCFNVRMNENTNVPKLCNVCSGQEERCRWCMQSCVESICGCGKTKDMCRCVEGFGKCMQLGEDMKFHPVPMMKEVK